MSPSIGTDVLLDHIENRLDPTRRAEVEAALQADPALRKQAEALRRQTNQLGKLGESVLKEPIPEKLLSALDKLKGR
jgi:anti-sigma factor RsiW